MSDKEDSKPDWWEKNEHLKQKFDLPPYEPPQFEDGVYLHDVIPELEAEYNCTIRLRGVNVEYPDDWRIEMDGELVVSISRYRDKNGNTVFEMESEEFRSLIVNSSKQQD